MSNKLYEEENIREIANAIRSKNGEEIRYTVSQMAQAIMDIPTAYDVELGEKTITANGIYTPLDDGLDGYSQVTVNVQHSEPVYDTPTITVSDGGLITASANGKTNTEQLSTRAGATITPTESEQTAVSASRFTTGDVKVGAISSTYVGSAVPKQTAKTVTPTKNQQTAVASGRYTTGAVMVGAIPDEYIIPSGSMDITQNSTVDVTDLAEVVVNVPSEEVVLQDKSVTPTESSQTVTADDGYTALSSVEVGAISSTYVGSGITKRTGTDLSANGATITVPSGYYSTQQTKSVATGTAGTPSASKGTVSNHQITVTPTVTNTTGYITGGTKTGTAVTVSASDLVSGALDVSSNGNGIDVTNYKTINVNVPTGGGGMNVQAYFGVNTVSSTSYTATNTKLTVAKTGTYKVSWMGWRSTNSGTSGSQLYIAGTAYGSANTSFTNTYGQRVELTGVKLTAGQEIVVRARARSTSHVMAVGNLIIEQTA